MPVLPNKEYDFYLGLDPGVSGAAVLMKSDGTIIDWFDISQAIEAKDYDPEELWVLMYNLNLARPFECLACLEWPTSRPGEGHVGAEKLGRGKAYLEAFSTAMHMDVLRIPPNLWTGRLGLPGKREARWKDTRVKLFETYYPDHKSLIRGPRGGLKDGRLDAALIAHFCRTRGVVGLGSIVDKFGKDSLEAQAMILSGPRKRKSKRA